MSRHCTICFYLFFSFLLLFFWSYFLCALSIFSFISFLVFFKNVVLLLSLDDWLSKIIRNYQKFANVTLSFQVSEWIWLSECLRLWNHVSSYHKLKNCILWNIFSINFTTTKLIMAITYLKDNLNITVKTKFRRQA